MSAEVPRRPHLLLITTDQQRGDCLGVAGSCHPVLTPHLDQVAYEGVRYRRAYSDCPVCIPARTSIMTGRPAYRHGVVANADAPLPAPPESTLAGRLTVAGYQTHAVGKMHFSPPRRRNGFERLRLLPEDYVNWLERTPYPGGYRGHGLGGNEVYPVFSNLPVEYTPTHWVVDESIAFLRQRDAEAPFFMWVSFETPHPPFDPPEPFVRLYDGIDVPPAVAAEWSMAETAPPLLRHRRLTQKVDLLPAALVEKARRHYYAQITHVDYELGRLFGELKSQRLWEETVVLFTSDHGEMLGDHGLFHKSVFYEPSARVPFLLRIPERFAPPRPAGTVADDLVSLADVLPTLTELGGCAPADQIPDGVSLATPAGQTDRRQIVGQCGSGRNATYMVLDGSRKYVYFPWGGVEQLFDLDTDADERIDLSRSAPARVTLTRLRAALAEAIPALVDGGRTADDGCPFRREDATLPPNAVARAVNPFAWRGPIRYGGGW